MSVNINKNNRGSLDKTLSSFGLSNIDPQFLNPSLLHNGFMLDREVALTQSEEKSNRINNLSKQISIELPNGYELSNNGRNRSPEYEFLTIRPITRNTKQRNEEINPLRLLGNNPPTLPPPSGDIPPFVVQQKKFISKREKANKNISPLQLQGHGNNRPLLKKPLRKSRPPFPPPVQAQKSSFDHKHSLNQEGGETNGKNPILRLFKNVQQKSSSLSNLFSPKSWFNQGTRNKNSAPLRPVNKNMHNFNHRMASIKTPTNKMNAPIRSPIKMVEGNFHHPAKYRYETPVTQKSRDEKSRRDDLEKLHPPMDMDAAESIRTPLIQDVSGGVVNTKLHIRPGGTAKVVNTEELQKQQMQTMLEAEQLAAMIEAIADKKLMADAMKKAYLPTSNNEMSSAYFPKSKASNNNAMNLMAETRPTNKSLLRVPGRVTLPITNKRKSSYGQGFDPSRIQPESGFKPIVVGDVQSMPSLAFSVLDSMPDKFLDTQNKYVDSRDMTEIMQTQPSDIVHRGNLGPITSTLNLSNRRMAIKGAPSHLVTTNSAVFLKLS